MSFTRLTACLTLGACAIAAPALADPCKAIPDRGPMPTYLRKGAVFSGPVRYVGDGDSLCVGASADPATWIEVRLADWYAPELHEPSGPAAKVALEQVTKGHLLTCTADHRSYDRVVAACRIGARSVGDLIRATGAVAGGRGR